MWTILKAEFSHLFSSLIVLIVIGVFVIFLGLMLFVFPEFSILEAGYAQLNTFFELVPNIFMFLIPALTMRSFSEELQKGTYRLLRSKPLGLNSLILGKYLAILLVIIFSILLSLCYYYTVYTLSNPIGNIDSGAIWASYVGLILLAGAYTSIGLFASSLTENQIIAFILAVFMIFVMYYSFEFISSLPIFYGKMDLLIKQFGMIYHFNSLGKGVMDSRDLMYFISIIIAFISFTKLSLERE